MSDQAIKKGDQVLINWDFLQEYWVEEIERRSGSSFEIWDTQREADAVFVVESLWDDMSVVYNEQHDRCTVPNACLHKIY